MISSAGCDKKDDFLITFHTKYGDMKAILYDGTPGHKANFLKMARQGYYDSTVFHRVIQDFMIQGGDVTTQKGADRSDKELNELLRSTIPAEFNEKYYHKKGALAAARRGDRVNPDRESSACQFYIVQGKRYDEQVLRTDMDKLNGNLKNFLQLGSNQGIRNELLELYEKGDFIGYQQRLVSLKADMEKDLDIDLDQSVSPERLQAYSTEGGVPHLDDTYTVFGEVIEGLNVVDSIAAQPTRGEKPVEPVYVSVNVEEIPRNKITKQYGYEYPEEE